MVTVHQNPTTIDEWGRFLDSGIDEFGFSYFEVLNELGDRVYTFSSAVKTQDVANAGTPYLEQQITGETTTTSTVGNIGSVQITVLGSQGSVNDIARLGSTKGGTKFVILGGSMLYVKA